MAGALVTPADGCRLRPCRARNAAELSTILPPPQGRRARSSNGPQSRAVSGWPREPPRRGHWPRLAASSPINPAPCFHVSDKAATTRSDDRQAVRHLSALPQAVCYTLCAASLAVWWIWTAHNGAAGALFAATTVAAKPGKQTDADLLSSLAIDRGLGKNHQQ